MEATPRDAPLDPLLCPFWEVPLRPWRGEEGSEYDDDDDAGSINDTGITSAAGSRAGSGSGNAARYLCGGAGAPWVGTGGIMSPTIVELSRLKDPTRPNPLNPCEVSDRDANRS